MQWARTSWGRWGGTTECSHSTSNVFNSRLGKPRTGDRDQLLESGDAGRAGGPEGLSARGHDLAGGVYRAMVKTELLEIAFAPELAGRTRGIRKAQYHRLGGSWQWTLNPHFDIRLSGRLPFQAMATKTSHDCPTASPAWPGCSPVLAMTRR